MTSNQITGIKYLKYQMPQKPEEEKLKSFAFFQIYNYSTILNSIN